MKKLILILLFLITFNSSAKTNYGKHTVEIFPSSVSSKCRNGAAKIYDECSDQSVILKKALARANKMHKTVLVVFGAEWCIWCHVFDKYIKGQSRIFNYKWEYENKVQNWKMYEKGNSRAEIKAEQLNRFVSKNFVVAHIEGQRSPNGLKVLLKTGLKKSEVYYYPFILVLNAKGKYVANMRAYSAIKGLEIRKNNGEEYRGFDRLILLNELKKLGALAKK